MKQIVVATDLSDESDAVVAKGFEIAGPFDADVTVVHVLTQARLQDLREDMRSSEGSGEAYLDEVLTLMQDAVAEQVERVAGSADAATAVVARGTLADEVLGRARSTDADLIVLGLRSRSRVGKLIMGSGVQEILLSTPCAVLGVPI